MAEKKRKRLEKFLVVSEYMGQGLSDVLALPYSVIDYMYLRAHEYGTPAMRDARTQFIIARHIAVVAHSEGNNAEIKKPFFWAEWLEDLAFLFKKPGSEDGSDEEERVTYGDLFPDLVNKESGDG